MTEITVKTAEKRKKIPPENSLKFGRIFTDHMFVMKYEPGKGWHNAEIIPYQNIELSPAAVVLHYGQTIFEGMKAFRRRDNQIAVYRPLDHLNRFNRSAQILCIPEFDVNFLYKGLRRLLEIDKDWVPASEGTSLYIRPFTVATEPCLGVSIASEYLCYIILSPVGPYYSSGFNPVKIKVEENYVRAVKGGLGEAKTAANYAASFKAAEEAHKQGYSQVLWLDALEKKYVEEVGTMNIFFQIDDELITPKLNGSILNGMTRRSVIELAGDWGMKVSERRISIEEVYEAYAKGRLKEVFGTGTAAVISPVGELTWKNNTIVINGNKTGPTSQKLFDAITNIQQGLIADKFGWVDIV